MTDIVAFPISSGPKQGMAVILVRGMVIEFGRVSPNTQRHQAFLVPSDDRVVLFPSKAVHGTVISLSKHDHLEQFFLQQAVELVSFGVHRPTASVFHPHLTQGWWHCDDGWCRPNRVGGSFPVVDGQTLVQMGASTAWMPSTASGSFSAPKSIVVEPVIIRAEKASHFGLQEVPDRVVAELIDRGERGIRRSLRSWPHGASLHHRIRKEKTEVIVEWWWEQSQEET